VAKLAATKNRKADKPRARRSLENPNVPLNIADPDDDTFWALGGERSQAGVRVTQKRALGYPAVWRAVNLISGDVGKMPMFVYKLSGENKDVDRVHPAYRLLRYKANEFLLAYHLKQILTFHALIRGNGYGYIDRLANGNPLDITVLDPDKTEPVRVDGKVWYLYGKGDNLATYRRIPAADVIHIRGLGYDGLMGYPVLDLLRESIGAAIAARDHAARYFRNGARPGGVLEHPGKLSAGARQNMRESWERIHKGIDNAHKVAILEEGTKYTGFSANASDAQLLENREFDAREVANIFGVPTHKLGDPSKVAYNSLEQENQSYYDDTLSRWLRLWADECGDKLLSDREKLAESHCIDFDYQELARADLAAQTAYASAALQYGWENIDGIRAMFGKNPIADGSGQAYKAAAPAAPAVPAAPVTNGKRKRGRG
jgi:HK97 family phage portal protein